jgi:hypothetical protein
MALAFVGSILLLISTFLPHIVAQFPEGGSHSSTLWDLLRLYETPSTDVSIPVAMSVAVNTSFFAIRVRKWFRNFRPRVWTVLAVAINLLTMIRLITISSEFESQIATLSRGTGFYLMILACIVMVAGSVLSVVAPQRASATSGKASGSKPLTNAGSSDTTRAAPSASFQSDKRERPPVPAPYSPDIAARLRQLKSLLDDSLITQEEYDTRRTKILDDL